MFTEITGQIGIIFLGRPVDLGVLKIFKGAFLHFVLMQLEHCRYSSLNPFTYDLLAILKKILKQTIS